MHPRKEAGIVVDFVPQGRDAQRARRLAALAARRRLLPRGRARHAGAAPPRPAPRAPQAHAGAVARPGDARRAPPARRDPARVAAHRPEVPRRGRAALLGDDRRPRRCASRSAPSSSQKFTERGASKGALEQFLSTCAAENPNRRLRHDRARRPRLDAGRARRLRRPRHARHAGAAVGEGPRCRASACCCARSPRASPTRPSRSSPAGRGGSRARRARRRTARASAEFPEAKRLLGALANSRGHRHEENAARLVNAALRAAARRSAPRCSPRPRATRRARTSCSTPRASSSARSRRSPARSPRTCPQPKLQPSRRRRRKRKRKSDRSAGRAAASRRGTASRARRAAPGRRRSRAAAPKKRRRRRRKPAHRGIAAGRRTRRARTRTDAHRRRPSTLEMTWSFCSGSPSSPGWSRRVSPCVLPVLPILLAGGASGGRRRPYAIVAGLVVELRRLDPVRGVDPRASSACRRTCCATSRSRCSSSIAATLLFPQVGTARRARARAARRAPRGRPRRRLPARLRARLRVRPLRRPGPRVRLGAVGEPQLRLQADRARARLRARRLGRAARDRARRPARREAAARAASAQFGRRSASIVAAAALALVFNVDTKLQTSLPD